MPEVLPRTGLARLMPLCGLLLATGSTGCLGGGPAPVSPDEIPDLEARLERDPGNASLASRYAEALFAAGRCDTAQAMARRVAAARPDDAVPVLIDGQCRERANQYDVALASYQRYLTAHGDAAGAAAVRARDMLARRDQATAMARAAIIAEGELAAQPGNPQTVAVMPIQIVGDSSYSALSRGLAQMLISDLSLIQRFQMVERLQIGALLEELQLAQTDRVDPATAARVGRLVRAGRLVQGQATIPEGGTVRLEANVVQGTGEVSSPDAVTGRLQDLLRLEKDLVIGLAAQLGYTLAEAERQAILENGTQDLQAFLAYSQGLLAEDLGDFSRAALYYGDAVRADPNFQAARVQRQAAAAAPVVQQSQGQVAVAVSQTGQQQAAAPPSTPNALESGLGDLAATKSEQTASGATTGSQAGATTTSAPPPTTTNQGTQATVTGTVNVRFRLP